LKTIAEDQPYKVRFDIYGVPAVIHKSTLVFREIWNAILNEVDILLDGIRGNENYVFCLEIYTTCVTKLVTGLEVYLRNKFIESEEHIKVNYTALSKFVKKEKKLDLEKLVIRHLNQRKVLKNVVSIYREFNFQDWKKSRELFKKVYGIQFQDIPGVDDQKLRGIQDNLMLRHRIIHTDTVSGLLNIDELHLKPPVSLNLAYINQMKSDFHNFVIKLQEYCETRVRNDFVFNA
jgi:hypothetical protein